MHICNKNCKVCFQKMKIGMGMNKEMIFSVLLALGVVLSSIALLNGSLTPMKSKKSQTDPKPSANENQSRQINERKHDQQAPAAIDNAKTISKCTIGDKVIYSDKPCPKNGRVSQVEMHESSGIVMPSRDVVSETMQRVEEEQRRENQGTRSSIAIIEKPNKQLCAMYRTDIDNYDSMARQPQPGETQDWIRTEIVRIRKLQAIASC